MSVTIRFICTGCYNDYKEQEDAEYCCICPDCEAEIDGAGIDVPCDECKVKNDANNNTSKD